MNEIKIGNRVFDLKNHTYVMGILNVTPDSFSDGGLFINMLRPGVLSDHPIWDFVKYPLEIIIAIVAAIVGSIIYIKKKNI